MAKKKITSKELTKLLKKGVVKFSFTKVSGETRNAEGTVKLDLIPEDQRPKSPDTKYKGVRFYDLEKGEWRAVSEESKIYIL